MQPGRSIYLWIACRKCYKICKNKPFLLGSFCTIWMFLFIGNYHLFQSCRELRSVEILRQTNTEQPMLRLMNQQISFWACENCWMTHRATANFFFFWLFELGMLAWTYLGSSPSCHHWQCEFPTSKHKSELSKSSQKLTSRCWRQHVRISTWWPAIPIISFAIPILYSHASDYNMFNCFPRLYSEPIRPACCPVTTPAYQLHTVSAECTCAWPVSAYSH